MMISTRYALPLASILALALVPVVVHSYAGVVDDGRRASALQVRLDGAPGMETRRKPDWVKRRLGSEDWMERRYVADGLELVMFVGRSHDPKALYHHPELALAYGHELEASGVVDVGGVPAHALRAPAGPARFVLYALESDGRFVTDPIRYQIASALTGLVRGRRPMTLFFVLQVGGSAPPDLSSTPAARLLREAVAAFERQ